MRLKILADDGVHVLSAHIFPDIEPSRRTVKMLYHRGCTGAFRSV